MFNDWWWHWNRPSVYRPRGSALSGTGGTASGAVEKMRMINELGRSVMQGGREEVLSMQV